MIETRDLRRSFGGVAALDGVTLRIDAGERRAIIGPNGAGKTTLFNILTGELEPTSGTVLLAGADVTRRPPYELARRGLARMYQRNELFETLAALDNVLLALVADHGPYRPLSSPSTGERAEAVELLVRVGLAERAAVPARSLSHGERRQLELALALARRPRVLLLDEPTAGMSPVETARITELIASLERSLTIVIVEHDMDVVFRLADRISVLHEGRVLAEGTPDAVRGDRVVNEVYLGKVVA
ncbi:MAG TPA: ABC transporter ATP-binding protein [Methylomirabilota bacterium]|nr:ABC transporter ATP-binding protein [Methylomirabilota bacterium]